jgi:hypothetical protein
MENKKDTEESNQVNLLRKYGKDGKPIRGRFICIGQADSCDKVF